MPKRFIEFPEPVTFYNPATKEKFMIGEKEDKMDFGSFLDLVMSNPMWNDGYAQMQAQDSILRSYETAKKEGANGMWIAEEDHKFLEKAVREPRYMLLGGPMGPQVLSGFGRHPTMARQFLPLQDAVVKAKTESEKAKEDEKKS